MQLIIPFNYKSQSNYTFVNNFYKLSIKFLFFLLHYLSLSINDYLFQKLPKIFVEKYWKRIPNPVILRLPNGAQQEIFWVGRDGDIWFKRNWENFAKSLKYGYALVFKYIGGPYFKVKIFGHNTLEKDYSNIKFIDESCEGREEVQEVVELSDDKVTNSAGTSQRRKNGKRKINQQKINGEFICFFYFLFYFSCYSSL